MFTNARNMVIKGGIFMANDGGRRCEHTIQAEVKILIVINSDGISPATYCSRGISQL
jgi:hypothetical protein